MILLVNWLTDRKILKKLKNIYTRKSILFFITIYFVHLLGLIFTKNFDYAFHDLKIKLPLLALPIIIGTTEKLDLKKFKWLLLIFTGAVLVSTFISFTIYLFQEKFQITDHRHISVFISHIRFSLMIDLSIFVLLYIALTPAFKINPKNKILFSLMAVWFIFFLFILESLTGIVIFILIFPVFLIYLAFLQKNYMTKVFSVLGIIIVISAIGFYIDFSIRKFYSIEDVDLNNLSRLTENNRLYYHDTESKLIENGHYVWIYLNEEEVRKEWNLRSNYKYDSLDIKGQELKHTLIRYLTSKGLRKDSVGVTNLSTTDIIAIENGNSNYIFNQKFTIYPRLYQFIWELDVYKKEGYASGHSVIQRIEYLKNALMIIKRNFWTGVGTGDVQDEFTSQYRVSESKISPRWQLRAHNQYVTFLLTFGIVGFLWILFAFFYPVYYERKSIDFLAVLFLLIVFLSMLNEDTLETHTGISFFVFFYSLFVFGYTKKDGKTGN